jgi:HB1, ASXL, restriction endonuclease HTH domain
MINTFKGVAYEILKEARKPLHSDEITKIALQKGWLKTAGKTPEATMNAQLVVDINKNLEKSLFVKTGPSIFAINAGTKTVKKEELTEEHEEKEYKVSPTLMSVQKGSIVEARVAELILLYGTSLSCYRPLSDDEGIDLIVKEKGSLKSIYIQIKSNFSDDFSKPFVATVKERSTVDNYSMAFVFCLFDTAKGDVHDYVWFVPAPDFIRMAHKDKNDLLGFVSGKQKKDSNKWDAFMIDKRDLADRVTRQLKRI